MGRNGGSKKGRPLKRFKNCKQGRRKGKQVVTERAPFIEETLDLGGTIHQAGAGNGKGKAFRVKRFRKKKRRGPRNWRLKFQLNFEKKKKLEKRTGVGRRERQVGKGGRFKVGGDVGGRRPTGYR